MSESEDYLWNQLASEMAEKLHQQLYEELGILQEGLMDNPINGNEDPEWNSSELYQATVRCVRNNRHSRLLDNKKISCDTEQKSLPTDRNEEPLTQKQLLAMAGVWCPGTEYIVRPRAVREDSHRILHSAVMLSISEDRRKSDQNTQ